MKDKYLLETVFGRFINGGAVCVRFVIICSCLSDKINYVLCVSELLSNENADIPTSEWRWIAHHQIPILLVASTGTRCVCSLQLYTDCVHYYAIVFGLSAFAVHPRK